MPKLCCYCIELRVACIIIAIISVLGPLGGLAFERDLLTYTSVVLSFIANGSLLFGAIKRSKAAIDIYLVIAMGQIAIWLLGGTFKFIELAELYQLGTNTPEAKWCIRNKALCRGGVVTIGSGYMISVCISIYFWVCAFCFLKTLSNNTSGCIV